MQNITFHSFRSWHVCTGQQAKILSFSRRRQVTQNSKPVRTKAKELRFNPVILVLYEKGYILYHIAFKNVSISNTDLSYMPFFSTALSDCCLKEN